MAGIRLFNRTILAVATFAFTGIQAAAQDIPAAMRGTWAEKASFCTTPESDGRIAVSARSVQFFASDCTVKRSRNLGQGRLQLDVQCEESGEKQNGVIELRLLPDGKLSLKLDSEQAQALLRCAGNPRVR